MGKEKTAKRGASGNPYAYSVLQNLRDAGCTDEMIAEFMSLQGSADEQRQLQLLSEHRKCLLEQIHRAERHISCLDYLLYQMQKTAGN